MSMPVQEGQHTKDCLSGVYSSSAKGPELLNELHSSSTSSGVLTTPNHSRNSSSSNSTAAALAAAATGCIPIWEARPNMGAGLSLQAPGQVRRQELGQVALARWRAALLQQRQGRARADTDAACQQVPRAADGIMVMQHAASPGSRAAGTALQLAHSPRLHKRTAAVAVVRRLLQQGKAADDCLSGAAAAAAAKHQAACATPAGAHAWRPSRQPQMEQAHAGASTAVGHQAYSPSSSYYQHVRLGLAQIKGMQHLAGLIYDITACQLEPEVLLQAGVQALDFVAASHRADEQSGACTRSSPAQAGAQHSSTSVATAAGAAVTAAAAAAAAAWSVPLPEEGFGETSGPAEQAATPLPVAVPAAAEQAATPLPVEVPAAPTEHNQQHNPSGNPAAPSATQIPLGLLHQLHHVLGVLLSRLHQLQPWALQHELLCSCLFGSQLQPALLKAAIELTWNATAVPLRPQLYRQMLSRCTSSRAVTAMCAAFAPLLRMLQ